MATIAGPVPHSQAINTVTRKTGTPTRALYALTWTNSNGKSMVRAMKGTVRRYPSSGLRHQGRWARYDCRLCTCSFLRRRESLSSDHVTSLLPPFYVAIIKLGHFLQRQL